MRNPEPANWGKWSLIPHPELWQAVCLSMDIEPPKSCDVVEFLRLDQKTFKDRMQVCVANTPPQPNPVFARVNFANFAAVVCKWGWPIPEQLKALAKSWPIKPETETAPATPRNTPPVERHTTKGKRRDTLTPVIEHAQDLCKNRWDTAEVWGQLHTLTAKKYSVLLHLEANAIFYTDGDQTKTLTKKNLGDRLRGMRNRLAKPP